MSVRLLNALNPLIRAAVLIKNFLISAMLIGGWCLSQSLKAHHHLRILYDHTKLSSQVQSKNIHTSVKVSFQLTEFSHSLKKSR